MSLTWQPDRRQSGAFRAESAGAHLTAESDGFRVELGSLSIDGDAQSLEQAQVFAEAALSSLQQLDTRLATVDTERLARGARKPVQAQLAAMRPMTLLFDPECDRCKFGMRREIDGASVSYVLCDCVRSQ